MKYEKNQYSSGGSICALLIAGIFFYWGIDAFLHGFWQFGINWMGFLWIGIGAAIASSQIARLANRSKLRNVVVQEFQTNPNVSIEEISANTGISVKDIRAIILDLKASGILRGNFSITTGEAKSVEIVKPQAKAEITPEVQEKSQFCPNCGTPVSRDTAVYCAFCGGKL
jgi:NADH pyrophosphatase NudC (nudix superfamily)